MKRIKIFLGVGLSLLFLAGIARAETETITNDYSNDPQLIIIKDKSGEKDHHGNIAGAFYSIPSTEYGSVTQEFDIHFLDYGHYGRVMVGLKSREYTGEMQISFYFGDTDQDIKKARGHLLFKNEGEIPVNATTDIGFDRGRTYHIQLKYQEGEYVQVVVSGKDEEGLLKLWDSGKLKVTGKANFNRVYFDVRSATGSDIHYDKELKCIYLKGVAGGSYTSTAHVDNMVIKYKGDEK